MSRPRVPELDTKIIEAATEEFHAVGYGSMSLGSIAVRAGVRPGAVYTRFRDKRDVLRAILEHVSTLRAERIRNLPGDDPYENLLYATRETHTSVSWEHAFTIPALALMGTEEANEVRDLIRDVAPGGGYALSSANSIPEYVPWENFVALHSAWLKYGRYPIDL